MITSGPSSPCNSFSMLLIHSAFHLWFFSSHILLRNCLYSFISGYWFVLMYSPPACWENFLSLFWNVLFYLFCLTLSPFLWSFPSFANIFWFISSNLIVRLDCYFVLVFWSQYILACFFFHSTFACCRSFFTSPSSLISNQGFVFLFGFIRGLPILSKGVSSWFNG